MTYIPGKDIALTTTRCFLMTLREYPAKDITSLLNNLRSQHSHLISTGQLICDHNTDHPQSPLTHSLHNLARTLNIPSCQHSVDNPRPTDAQQHARYIRAATIYPCLVTNIDKPGTPCMCEYCDLLQHVIRKSPTNDFLACAMPHTDANTLSTCSVYVLYALIHQNTFAQRWNDIQTAVTTAQRIQINASLNSPQRMECATPPRGRGIPIRSDVPTDTVTNQPSTHMSVNLALSKTTLGMIRQILITPPATHRCAREYIPHLAMPITKERLVTLRGVIRSGTDELLSITLLYHHFRLTAMSELISDDRKLEPTVDNAIHILTPPQTTNVATPYHLHLYLNPHDCLPYLQHTCTGNEPTSYRLIVTTSLPYQSSGSSSARRRPTMRTTAHAPDLVTTFTFPAASIQHQQSILTLATHLLLTVPIITRQ